jgi:hypothetical protein
MLERDMENLIAAYPDDFFPDRGFELKGRQQSFAQVGRFDLLFQDRFKTNILMELKAVPARYEDATQLAKYNDELRRRGENHIMMWLVAPLVSGSVREFLDRIGIEYSEIHEAQFQRVAERHGVLIGSQASPTVQEPMPRESVSKPKAKARSKKAVLPPERSRDFIKSTIHQLWDQQHSLVTRDQLAQKLAQQLWVTEALDGAGITDSGERTKRIENQIDWFSAHYKLGWYQLSEEFDRATVNGTWAYRPKPKSS